MDRADYNNCMRPYITGSKPKMDIKSEIIDLYWGKGLSLPKIAKIKGVADSTILRRMQYYEIPRRYQRSSEARQKMALSKVGSKNPCYGKYGKEHPVSGKVLSEETLFLMAEVQIGHIPWNKGLTVVTDERVRKNSENSSRMSGHKHSTKARHKMSISLKGKNTWSKGSKKSEQTRDRNRRASEKMWQDPNYVKKNISGAHKRPTRPELRLKRILGKHFPEFKYNGDYSLGVALNRLVPDFVNTNGKKQVIEVFGDYWHSTKMVGNKWRRSELGRIMAFNALGFECLVLWESELKNLSDEQITRRVKDGFR